jgi:8-oxo-dGTP diphosphatase
VVKRHGPRRRLVAFDWDGVLHRDRDWRPVFSDISVGLIHEAHERGYAAAVMTCNNVPRVTAALRELGVVAVPDTRMRHASWNGGGDGREVLVTRRKLAALAYVDDRAIHYRYGQDSSVVWEELIRRDGVRPGPAHRHWGPLGAAGVLLYAVRNGRVLVLLGKRSRRVQDGGTWSGFGGAIEQGEEPWATARRELAEEITGVENYRRGGSHVADDGCGWRYTTFLARVELKGNGLPRVRINPAAGWETDKLRWILASEVRNLRLHPGLAASWPELRRQLEHETGREPVADDGRETAGVGAARSRSRRWAVAARARWFRRR